MPRNRLPSLLLLLLAVFCPAVAHAQHSFVAGELLVGMKADADSAAEAGRTARPFGKVQKKLRGLRTYRVRLHPGVIAESAIKKLREAPGVAYVEPNWIRSAHVDPDDPAYPAQQYGPQRIQADRAWEIWRPARTAVIAIVDTGVETGHPEMANVVLRDASGNSIGYNSIAPANIPADDHGHGTHVAGIAAAEINNGMGIAGVAGWNPLIPGSKSYVKIMPIKVLNSGGGGNDGDIAEGVTWAADHGANVISMSLGSAAFSATLNNAVQYAWSQGVVVIASAGNSGGFSKNYPAGFDNVVSVAATSSTDTLTSFSTYGSWVDVAAPGLSIYSLYRGQSYATMSGTSMSAPHVAAEAAAIIAQNPLLTNAHVVDLIRTHVDPYVPYQGRTLGTGAGRINVFRAVKAAGDGTPILTSIAVSPAAVTGTLPCVGTVYLGGPAPTGGISVGLTGGDPTLAFVPEFVLVPEGELSATFAVGTQSVSTATSVTITGSTGSITESTVLTVTPPAVQSLSLSPTTVTSPANLTGTITLNAIAPEGGVIVNLSSANPAVVDVPATVNVAAGQTTATFGCQVASVSSNTNVTITASANGGAASATVLVKPPVVLGVTLNPTSIVGGSGDVLGTVSLTGPAPAEGAIVTLTSNNAAASVPPNVLVPAGESSATFPVATYRVNANATVSISASYGGVSRAAYLSVLTLLRTVTLTPSSVTGGAGSTGKVELNAPAGAGGQTVTLFSSSPAAFVPPGIAVPEGALSATFSVSTSPVVSTTSTVISATLDGATRTANLTVKAAAVSSVALNPANVVGGFTSQATVTLNGDAAAGGVVVAVISNSSAASVPASVTVPAGQRTASFTVNTTVVTGNALATISASAGGISRSAYLSVTPVGLASLTVSPTSVKGGSPATATVTLNGPAPAGGAIVTLASNNSAASVPASLTFAEGQTTATFTVSTVVVGAIRSVTLTATYRGASKTASLTVTP